jgi:hypothetical protein
MEQTEQKHSKKQTSCRDQRPSQNNKTTDEKSPTKVRYSRSTKKEEKQLSRGRRKLSLPLSRTNLSFKKRARAKSGESVFLIVGKYHLWYLTLNARYSVTSGRKRGGDRAWCARIFCAGKGGGVFRFLSSRRTSYQSLLVRFGFGRR